MDQMKEQCKEALEFINNGKLSEKNSDCTQEPFFLQSKPIEPNVGFNTHRVNAILDEVQLPEKIKTIYQVIGETNLEHYTGNWVLLTLDKIKNPSAPPVFRYLSPLKYLAKVSICFSPFSRIVKKISGALR